MPNRLIQIVPRLPPALDGVGEYGFRLAQELREAHGVETFFFCGNSQWRGPSVNEGFRVQGADGAPGRNLDRILTEEGLGDAVVLLNYAPTGYDLNSCPFWLLRSLRSWWRAGGRGRLVTMFHEQYSHGPPWTRAFWTHPFQRHIATRLARLSRVVRTNVGVMQERLVRMAPAHRGMIQCVPVFSNVGETLAPPPAAARKPWMAVFGTPVWRSKAYREYGGGLAKACVALGVAEIIDIGPPLDFSPQAAIPVKTCGRLNTEEVADWLRQCRFGFATYPSQWLWKSGIFAAYCAHGCIPIASALCRQSAPPGAPETPIFFDDEFHGPVALTAMQDRVKKWYEPHSLAAQGRDYAELFREIGPACELP